MAQLGKTSRKNMEGLDPRLIQLIEAAIEDTPVDFMVTSGVRTTKAQQALYAQGRTKPGAIVTQADGIKKKSNHQVKSDGFGKAFDFCPFINGALNWNATTAFIAIALHIKEKAKCLGIRIRWGADWDNDGITKAQGDKDETFVDLPHIELI